MLGAGTPTIISSHFPCPGIAQISHNRGLRLIARNGWDTGSDLCRRRSTMYREPSPHPINICAPVTLDHVCWHVTVSLTVKSATKLIRNPNNKDAVGVALCWGCWLTDGLGRALSIGGAIVRSDMACYRIATMEGTIANQLKPWDASEKAKSRLDKVRRCHSCRTSPEIRLRDA